MSKRLMLGVLLTAAALIIAACEVEEEADEPGSTATARPTAEATAQLATPEASPSGMAPRGTPAATVPVLIPRVRADAQLEVTLADIQVGKDGRYRIPDRGDGCAYRETGRIPAKVIGTVRVPEIAMLWADDCEVGYSYEPTTGRLNAVVP